MTGAPPGNTNAMKWSTPEERKAACERLCKHLRSGLSLQSFVEADEDTIKRYMKDFPLDFGTAEVKEAIRASRLFWEMVGVNGTLGKIKNFNASSWKFNMANRHGWKENVQHGSDPENPLPDNQPTTLVIVRTTRKDGEDDAPEGS